MKGLVEMLNITMKHIAIVACLAVALSASAYSCALYNSEVERQKTARMDLCIKGGGKWTTAWNWSEYCLMK